MKPIGLSIVSPTFNEASNVIPLISSIEAAMGPDGWELVLVDDDSPDGTATIAREIAKTDARIRCLQRIGRRGLASACIEGMLASSAPYVAVIDADLQHDEKLLPKMLERAEKENLDLVVASRYTTGGSTGEWDEGRKKLSLLATDVAKRLMKQDVTDPMSGFFLVSRDVVDESVRRLSALGFKILLDILLSVKRPLRIGELPYTFRGRQSGDSKLDSTEIWNFGMLLADKTVGKYIPVRFLSFIFVGGLGVFVHMGVLTAMIFTGLTSFLIAQSVGTIIAMVFNFSLNNVLTYRDKRLHGSRWFAGLLNFILVCSIGAIANVGVADYLFQLDTRWALAGLAGILVGAVWNFAMTQLYTWGEKN